MSSPSRENLKARSNILVATLPTFDLPLRYNLLFESGIGAAAK